jgi:proteasome assembly chaperone (PAC2) family protein
VALPEHVRWLSKPSLVKPTIVTAFTGWNDAADAASTAMRGLVEGWGAHRLAEIDPEPFTDFATIRPQVRLDDLSRRTIVWPTVGLWHVPTPGGDVILVLGPEPSLRWRLFTEQLISVARHFDAPLVVTLGALLADVPHSRPAQIIGTASDQDVIDRYDLQRSRYEGPIGIVGVLHDACATEGIPSVSLWAAVPAYASQVPSPKAAAALIRRLADLVGAPAPLSAITEQVHRYEEQVDSIVTDDDDLAAYVERLELLTDSGVSIDDEVDDGQLQIDFDETGGLEADEGDASTLVDEVERFLREQDGGSNPR